jgi:hypothetical protein
MSIDSPASILFDTNGTELAVTGSTPIPSGTRGLLVLGVDSSGNAQFLAIDSSGNQVIVGDGLSGSIRVQGVVGGAPLIATLSGSNTITGSVGITNWPITQNVTGSVLILNQVSITTTGSLPVAIISQPNITGSVNITNQLLNVTGSVGINGITFPSSQTVTGSVAILNQVSITTSGTLPTTIVGVSTITGSVSVTGSVGITNFPVVQRITGSVGVDGITFPESIVVTSTGSLAVAVQSLPNITGSVNVTNSLLNVAGNVIVTSTGSLPVVIQGTPTITGSVAVVTPISIAGVVSVTTTGSLSVAVQSLPNITGSVNITNQVLNVTGSVGVDGITFPESIAVTSTGSLAVAVQTLPNITGSVNVTNSVLTITGSVGVNGITFPSSQTVTGSVSITNQVTVTSTGSLAVSLSGVDVISGALSTGFINSVDLSNSTSTPMTGSGIFQGSTIDLLGYASLAYSVFSDKDSATNGVIVQFSPNGNDWDDRVKNTYTADGTVSDLVVRPHDRYARIKYINGNQAQSTFRFQTILSRIPTMGDSIGIDHPPTSGDDAMLVKAIISGKSSAGGGAYVDVKVNPAGSLLLGGGVTPTDTYANPTDALPSVAFNMGWNGTSWDRITSDGINTDATVQYTSGTLHVRSFPQLFNGTTWDRQRGTIANGLLVDVSRIISGVSVYTTGTLQTTGSVGITNQVVITTTGSLPVSVGNFPTSYSITSTGSLAVAIQSQPNITGSVNVTNSLFNVTGSVGVNGIVFPTTQTVTGSVAILNQVVITSTGSLPVTFSGVSNITGSVDVTGSVGVTNWPATLTVTGSVLSLPAGIQPITGSVAILNQVSITTSGTLPVTFSGTSTITGSVGISQEVAVTVQDKITSYTFNAINSSVTLAVNGRQGIAIRVPAGNTHDGSINIQYSMDDGATWLGLAAYYAGDLQYTLDSTKSSAIYPAAWVAQGQTYVCDVPSGITHVRLNTNTWTSGAVTVSISLTAAHTVFPYHRFEAQNHAAAPTTCAVIGGVVANDSSTVRFATVKEPNTTALMSDPALVVAINPTTTASVNVLNSVSVTGSVGITNWPVVQQVTGSVELVGSITATNPSVLLTGSTEPSYATLVAGLDEDTGQVIPINVGPMGHLGIAGNTMVGYAGEVTVWSATGNTAPAVDAYGGLYTRGQVMTDEGSFNEDFRLTLSSSLAGTVIFTSGSSTVTGTGTSFLTQVNYYSFIKAESDTDAFWIPVDNVTSDSELTLTAPYASATVTGSAVVSNWQPHVGAGGLIAMSGSSVNVGAGPTSGSVTGFHTIADYIPVLGTMKFSLSQRIANQQLFFGFFNDIDNPQMTAGFLFDGTTNTTVKTVSSTTSYDLDTQTTPVTLPNGVTSAVQNTYQVIARQGNLAFLVNGYQVSTHNQHVLSPYADLKFGFYARNLANVSNATTASIDSAIFESIDRLDAQVWNTNPDWLQTTVNGKTTTGVTVPIQVSTAGIVTVAGAVTVTNATAANLNARVVGPNTPSDAFANPTTAVPDQAFLQIWNASGNSWTRARGMNTNVDSVAVTTGSTALAVGAHLFGYNDTSTAWDRIRTVNGALTVDLTCSVATGSTAPQQAIALGAVDSGNIIRGLQVTNSSASFWLKTQNPSEYLTGSGAPQYATLIGGSDNGTMRAFHVESDGTLRIDPTGTTTQPISGAVNVTNTVLTVTGSVLSLPAGTQSITGSVAILNQVSITTSGSLPVTLVGVSTITGSVATLPIRANNQTTTSVSASTGAVTLLAANGSRLAASIYNNTNQDLYVKYGSGASLTPALWKVRITKSGGYFEFPQPVFTGLVSGVWAASGSGSALISEETP